jgi:hypothetical protein
VIVRPEPVAVIRRLAGQRDCDIMPPGRPRRHDLVDYDRPHDLPPGPAIYQTRISSGPLALACGVLHHGLGAVPPEGPHAYKVPIPIRHSTHNLLTCLTSAVSDSFVCTGEGRHEYDVS